MTDALQVPAETSQCVECAEEPDDAGSFREWVHAELSHSPLHGQGYTELLARAEQVVCDLRQRIFELSDKATWLRLMKRGRLLKEINEVFSVHSQRWSDSCAGAPCRRQTAAVAGGQCT